MFRFCLLIGLLYVPVMIWAVDEPIIVVLGDSLSTGYGIDFEQGWVTRLQERLTREGYRYRVVNASVSGETTRGALARLDPILDAYQPAIVIVELGGNDGLRGLSLEEIRQNFSKIIEKSKASGAKVLLLTMRLPPNYGAVYIERFQTLFDELIREHVIDAAPFILHGIADRPELMQEDGIHPRAEAQILMLDTVWPALVPLL